MKEVYLGDGAYAKWDGQELVIYTSNGVFSTNSVYLETPAIRKLAEFIVEMSK